MGQRFLSPTSVARSHSAVREAFEGPDVPLRFWESVTTALGLGAAIFSVLGLEDFSERLQIGLEGVLGVVLGHDGPSEIGLV